MKNKHIIVAGLIALLIPAGLWAQDEAEKKRKKEVEVILSASGAGHGGTYRFLSSQASFDLTPVKGAPYSAEAVTTTSQKLPDGNQIFRESVTRVYRDSEGRTRREMELPVIGAWVPEEGAGKKIFIHDPVEGVSYTLNPEEETAYKTSFGVFSLRETGRADEGSGEKKSFVIRRKKDGQLEVEGGDVRLEEETVIVREAKVRRAFKEKEAAEPIKGKFRVSSTTQEGPHVRFYSRGDGGSQFFHFLDEFDEADIRKEALGTRTFEGVVAEGERTVRTIPAGKIGNEMPIEIVSERWYSSDLQTVVMSRKHDPRFGEQIFQLRNIDQSEPNPSLFQVPSDYTLKEGSGGAFHYKMRRKDRP